MNILPAYPITSQLFLSLNHFQLLLHVTRNYELLLRFNLKMTAEEHVTIRHSIYYISSKISLTEQ